MPDICPIYARYMPDICPIYARYMPDIWWMRKRSERVCSTPASPSRFMVSSCLDRQRQSENGDEAGGVLLVVARAHSERSQVRPVERVRRRAPGDDDVALVEFQPHVAAHWRHQAVDESVESIAQRREPLAEIDHLGVFVRDDLFIVRRLAVEAERFEFAQGREQQRPARSLIDAA